MSSPALSAIDADPLRRQPIETTYESLLRSSERFGVARLGSITRLDALGLATATAIRRDPLGVSVSVCSGKGPSELHAKVGALGEALERFAAEPRGRLRLLLASFGNLGRPGIDPGCLVPAEWANPCDIVEWCEGRTLKGRPLWVPANAVLFPYEPNPPAKRLFRAHTHGLAVGSDRDEAAVHALLECIERDAYARGVALASVGRGAEVPVIASGELEERAQVRAVLDAGLRVTVRDLTCDTGVPVLLCTIAEGKLAHFGVSAHPRAEVALSSAIFEAAQSRLTDIQGAREDLPDHDEPPADPWFLEPMGSRAASLPTSLEVTGPAEALERMSERLERAHLPEPAIVDLSLDGVAMSVVRVVAPLLESWAHDPERAGARARTWLSAEP